MTRVTVKGMKAGVVLKWTVTRPVWNPITIVFFLMECLIHKSLAITVPSGEVDLTNTKPYITAPTDSVASIKRASHTAF